MGFLTEFDAFHERAAQAVGLDDFGAADYVGPMKLLLSDYDEHSRFAAAGTQMVGAGIVGQLAARLLAQQGFKSHRESLTVPIDKPIFIVGMMRTGSTALHRLISKDPSNQWLPPWLGVTPMPRPARESWESNLLYQQMVEAFVQLDQLNPRIRQAHPMSAGEPDECRFATDPTFWSPGMAATAVVPEYAQWCLNGDARYAYREYRRVLALIAGGSHQRWVLKDVCHLWGVDALLDVFPDACIVVTHRDLRSSMPSMASLAYELRRLREPELTPEQNARELIPLWGQALDKTEQVRARNPASRFLDVRIEEIESDPMGTVERIYRHFQLPMSDSSRRALKAHAAMNIRAGHSARRYSLEDFGLTEHEVHSGVGLYYDRYLSLYMESA